MLSSSRGGYWSNGTATGLTQRNARSMKTKLATIEVFCLAVFGLLYVTSQCHALTIVVNDRWPRNRALPGFSGTSKSFAAGSLTNGTGIAVTEPQLKAVVRSAADWWEEVYADVPWTVTIDWAALHPSVAGSVGSTAPTALSGGKVSKASIAIAASGITFYVDNTPYDDGEYPMDSDGLPFVAAVWTGSRWIEVARHTDVTTDPAAGQNDLWTMIAHEMGHALGFVDWSGSNFRSETGDNDIDVGIYGAPWNSSWATTEVQRGHYQWGTQTHMIDALMAAQRAAVG